ncbi:MAG: oligosaccharide flippase family protein [Candidatus Rokubacteria bacterium]|nr:oligosaccharide flippase family protein [Candidatus Rokubacteria bacterium]
MDGHRVETAAVADNAGIGRRSTEGILLLAGGAVAVRAASFVANVFLARWLEPSAFGLFAIVGFIVTFFQFFSDFGLSGAMVQKRAHVGEDDLRTAFTIQQGIVTLFVIGLFVAAPTIVRAYDLAPAHAWLIRALSVSLFISSFRSMSAVQLERVLRYRRLVPAEVAETLSYQGIALVLAYLGYGVWSLIWGSVLSSLVGTAMIFVSAPWRVRLGIKREAVRELFRFGGPYQLVRTINLVMGSFGPVFVGKVVGPTGLGYLTWAQTLIGIPNFFLANIGVRVTFPAFARLQGEPEALRREVEKFILLSSMTFYPLAFILMAAGPDLVRYVYTPKWEPGLLPLYLMTIAHLTQPFGGSMVNNLFFAAGGVGMMVKLTLVWTALAWGVGMPLVWQYGYLGVPLMNIVQALTVIWTLWEARKICSFHPFRNALPPLLASVLTFFFVRALCAWFVHDVVTLVVATAIGLVGYLALIFLAWPRGVLELWDCIGSLGQRFRFHAEAAS